MQTKCSQNTGQTSPDSETCENAGPITSHQLTLFAAGSHVNLTPLPGSAEARQMTARSGRKCAALCRSSGRLGSLVRMFLESSIWHSTVCYLTWKISATKRGRLLFRLVPSARHTSEAEYSFWPTPNTSRWEVTNSTAGCTPTLLGMARRGLWPTPTEHGNYNRRGASRNSGDGLATAVRMWRTPSATVIAPKSSVVKLSGRMPQDPQVGLADQVGGQLNAEFVEYLMNFPRGWTDLTE